MIFNFTVLDQESELTQISAHRLDIDILKRIDASQLDQRWFRPLSAAGHRLEGCVQGSVEEAELAAIAGTIEAYEAKRWPEGKSHGRKGIG